MGPATKTPDLEALNAAGYRSAAMGIPAEERTTVAFHALEVCKRIMIANAKPDQMLVFTLVCLAASFTGQVDLTEEEEEERAAARFAKAQAGGDL